MSWSARPSSTSCTAPTARCDEAPGGSPANVALTLGRLGRAPRLVTRLADDAHGRAVRTWLERSGVAVEAVDAPRTATATARLDAAGAATYGFDIEWALGAASIGDADVLHVGSVAALLEPGAGDVSRLVDEGRARAIITYDPNIRPSLLPDPDAARILVDALVRRSDIVKASDEDLRWLHPDAEPVEVATRWQRSGPAVVVVTTGADGAFAVTSGGVVLVPGVRTEVIDTVGAGDTFMGALIDAVIDAGLAGAERRDELRRIPSDDLDAILRRCAAAAAITVSRPGADPPTRARAFLRQPTATASGRFSERLSIVRPPRFLGLGLLVRRRRRSLPPLLPLRLARPAGPRRPALSRVDRARGVDRPRRMDAGRRRARAQRRPRVRRPGHLDRLDAPAPGRHVVHVLHGVLPRPERQERAAHRVRDLARPRGLDEGARPGARGERSLVRDARRGRVAGRGVPRPVGVRRSRRRRLAHARHRPRARGPRRRPGSHRPRVVARPAHLGAAAAAQLSERARLRAARGDAGRGRRRAPRADLLVPRSAGHALAVGHAPAAPGRFPPTACSVPSTSTPPTR